MTPSKGFWNWHSLANLVILSRAMPLYSPSGILWQAACFLGLAFSSSPTKAQIVPDTTLGAESSIITPITLQSSGSPVDVIQGGATRGTNLFHSFEQFSIPSGSAAYFNNAPDIQNIIGRVTGASISNIDGLIGANASANLLLLNPNGIIFGPNAWLNIGGSFLGSTASAVNFVDGTQFSATVHTTTPLLTMSVPVGLQFGGTAGSIRNQSREFVLQVQSGKTLALLGGDVELDGVVLSAPGGRVELGAVVGPGTVGLAVDNLSLSYPEGVQRADVSLTNQAIVSVTAGGGGSIAVNARNLDILGESGLSAGIASGLGSVDTQAGDITLNATGTITLAGSAIFSNVDGLGDAGTISIRTSGLVSLINNSSISSAVGLEAVGNGGNIDITASSLSLDEAFVFTDTFGWGNAGRVSVQTNDSVSLSNNSLISSGVGPGSVGNGGNIDITAGSLSLDETTFVSTTTFGQGRAGSVSVEINDSVYLSNNSGISNAVGPEAMGNGGNIDITAGSLSLTNESILLASTLGQGNAGSVSVQTNNSISLSNSSFIASTVEQSAMGNGSDIHIQTRELSLTDGAEVTASSIGSGNAGNIEVAAGSIRLDNQALLSSDTTGGQGNIFLRSGDLVLRRGSNISTNAVGTASGGNITIDTDFIAASENSDISANAQAAFGGRVIINAQGTFGTEFRDAPSLESDITATSALGPQFSGTVQINTPEVDPSRGLVTLSTNLIDAAGLIIQGCGGGGRAIASEQNQFIVTGRGGLPPSPSEALSSQAVWQDIRLPAQQAASRSSSEVSSSDSDLRSIPQPSVIVEAQGWVVNNKGEVVLTAQAPSGSPHIPWLTKATCQTP